MLTTSFPKGNGRGKNTNSGEKIKFGPPTPGPLKISKVVLGFRNFGYDCWRVGGDVWRWLCRHIFRKISAHVDGGASIGSSARTSRSKDPHGRERKFSKVVKLLWENIQFSQLYLYQPLIQTSVFLTFNELAFYIIRMFFAGLKRTCSL